MKEYLKKLPKEIQDLIYLAGDIASKNNIPAYLVGGFVRDLILGLKNLDVDIVVEGDGIRFAELLSKELNAGLIRHKRFGTATVTIRKNLKIDPSTSLRIDGERPSTSLRTALSERSESNGRSRTIDIATARKESYPEPASLPEVSAGGLEEDLARRDFTINAMAISLNRGDFGKLIDFFRGQSDLKQKKVRVLHDLSFIDDPTRILRAIRFEKRYNFRIEPHTLFLLKEAVKRKMLEEVQPHRLRDELILMLKEERTMSEIMRTQELAGFGFIEPRLHISKKTRKLLVSIEKEVNWFKKVFPRHRKLDAWLIYFMGMVDALDAERVRLVCSNFAFRKGEEKRILSFKKVSKKFIKELSKTEIKPSSVFSMLESESYEAIIMLRAKYKNQNLKKHIKDFFEVYNATRICVNGDDLCRLGVEPGPRYQKIFSRVLEAKLNGLIKTREEELALIQKLVKIL